MNGFFATVFCCRCFIAAAAAAWVDTSAARGDGSSENGWNDKDDHDDDDDDDDEKDNPLCSRCREEEDGVLS